MKLCRHWDRSTVLIYSTRTGARCFLYTGRLITFFNLFMWQVRGLYVPNYHLYPFDAASGSPPAWQVEITFFVAFRFLMSLSRL